MNIYPRSKCFILENIGENPGLIAKANWNEAIPDDIENPFYSSFDVQLQYLIDLHILNIHEICSILKISTKMYYQIIKKTDDDDAVGDINDEYEEEEEEESLDDDADGANVGRPPLVTEEEEEQLLQQILECQERGDCMSPREARMWLQNFASNYGKFVVLDRKWWYNFKRKYKDLLMVLKIHSLENKRFGVTKEQVNDYFDRLQQEIIKCPYPPIIINVDESGFIRRPCKNKSKNCVFRKDCPCNPCFRDADDGNHVSVVGAVTLSGIALTPMLISTTKNPPGEIKNTVLENKFTWYHTTSGYLNTDAMIYWINTILIPYLELATSSSEDELSPLLLFDNLKSHLSERVTDLLNEKHIRFCCLPPHSSHLLQVLDLSFFGSMKMHYKICESSLFHKDSKMACKIEKILKAYYFSCFPTIIMAGWIESGFDLIYSNGNIKYYSFDRNRVISKLIKH